MSVATDFIKSIDSSSEIADEIKEALDLLINTAQTKADLFEQEIESDLITCKTIDNLTIPVTKVLLKDIQCRAVTAQDPSPDITSIVTEDMSDMFSGRYVNRKRYMRHNRKSNQHYCRHRFGNRNVKRFLFGGDRISGNHQIDFKFWGRAVQAQSLREQIHNAITSVVYKSAVDVDQLDFNTFLSVYAPILNDAYDKDIYKIKDALIQAKEVFNIYKSEENKIKLSAEDLTSTYILKK